MRNIIHTCVQRVKTQTRAHHHTRVHIIQVRSTTHVHIIVHVRNIMHVCNMTQAMCNIMHVRNITQAMHHMHVCNITQAMPNIMHVRNITQAMRNAREKKEQNLLLCVLAMVAQCVFALVEFLTQFATVSVHWRAAGGSVVAV